MQAGRSEDRLLGQGNHSAGRENRDQSGSHQQGEAEVAQLDDSAAIGSAVLSGKARDELSPIFVSKATQVHECVTLSFPIIAALSRNRSRPHFRSELLATHSPRAPAEA